MEVAPDIVKLFWCPGGMHVHMRPCPKIPFADMSYGVQKGTKGTQHQSNDPITPIKHSIEMIGADIEVPVNATGATSHPWRKVNKRFIGFANIIWFFT